MRLVDICGFAYSDIGDKTKKIEITEDVMLNVTKYIMRSDHLEELHILFELPNDPTEYTFVEATDKSVGKQRFSRLMTKCLKHLGLKLNVHTNKRRGKKRKKGESMKIKKYSLQRMFDVK